MEQSAELDKVKVLIAEDDKHVRLIYNIGLIDQVFEKRFDETGSEILKIYKWWQPDILILDIMLPGASGYAILKAIRQDMKDETTPIMMASCLSRQDIVVPCIQLGVQGYLVKPFTHREIARKVLDCYQKANPEKGTAALARFDAVRARIISF
jgi:DNA-binding response OmpR family regulator